MWLLIVCFINVNICYSLTSGEVTSNSSCQISSESGSIHDESSNVTLSQGSCLVSPMSSGIPVSHAKEQSNPRYSRAILSSKTRVPQDPPVVRLGITEDNDQEEYNQGPRTMQPSTQNTFTPQANFGSQRPSEQELTDGRGSPEQAYSRSLYPTPEGSFIPPISHQGNFPSMSFNHGTLPNHAFGGRSCPFCNSPLPPEFMYQRQMSTFVPHQFQQNPQVNQFSQQYSMLQGRVGYENIKPVVKTSPTLATEEMCPYDDGSAPEITPISLSMTYNRTVQDARESPGAERYSPAVENTPPAYHPVKNVPFSHGQADHKTMAGVPLQLNYKGIKMQRSESVKKNVGFNGNM